MSVKEITENVGHSKIGASSMYRWSACPGSVQMCEIAETPAESVHAKEGTLAHEVAAHVLEFGDWPDVKALCEKIGYEDFIHELTSSRLKNMGEAVSQYVDFVKRLQLYQKNPIFKVENRFDLSSVFPGAFGTADYTQYCYEEKRLHVVDYKHGQGIVVEVENNSQLLYYALGAALTLKLPLESIQLTVVQPRAWHPKGPVRTWITDPIKLLEFSADLVKAAKKTQEPNAPFKAGDHCYFCSAIDICPKSEEAKKFKRERKIRPRFKPDPKKEFSVFNSS